MADPLRWDVDVPGGSVPVLADAEGPETVLILAHGAGSHMEQKTLEWLSGLARPTGLRLVRFNFLYRALGRGMPDRMPTLVSTYRAVIASVRERLQPECLLIGGHSMGGRVASMLEAEEGTADGLVLFGYPLHPPDEVEKLRDGHLPLIHKPVLQLNGTEDAFCTKELMDEVATRLDPKVWTLHWIRGADHSYAVRRSSGRNRAEVEKEIEETLSSWLALNFR